MCPFEKTHFLIWIDLNPGFGRNQHKFLTKFANGTFKTLQLKAFGPKNIKFHARNQKCQIRNRQFGTFDSLHGT